MKNELLEIFANESFSDVSDSLATAISLVAPTPIDKLLGFAVKILGKWSIVEVCQELHQRNMTIRQTEKMNIFVYHAISTFNGMINDMGKDNTCNENPETESWYDSAYEIAENLFIKAANESQTKKLIISGRFFGREMALNNTKWESIYFLTNLFSQLSYRQIIMIKLLVEYIPQRPKSKGNVPEWLELKETTTIMEFQQLLTLGMFEVGENSVAWATIDLSAFDFFSDIHSTDLAHEIYQRFMLDKIPFSEVEAITKTF